MNNAKLSLFCFYLYRSVNCTLGDNNDVPLIQVGMFRGTEYPGEKDRHSVGPTDTHS